MITLVLVLLVCFKFLNFIFNPKKIKYFFIICLVRSSVSLSFKDLTYRRGIWLILFQVILCSNYMSGKVHGLLLIYFFYLAIFIGFRHNIVYVSSLHENKSCFSLNLLIQTKRSISAFIYFNFQPLHWTPLS